MSERYDIVALGHRGDGIARTPEGDIYIPGTLPGETVEARRRPGRPHADLVAVLTPSAERVAPPCPHFGVCGGCALQHLAAAPYAAFKRDLVVTALRQHGLAPEVAALVPAHGCGRRRTTFHARRGTHDVLTVGYAAARAHRIVPITTCPILDPALAGALPAAWAIAEALDRTRKPLDIQVTATDGGLDIDVRGAGPAADRHRGELAAIAEARDLARLTLHGDLVALRRPPTLAMGRAVVELPPGAFLQATTAGEAALARLVLEMAGPAKAVADLFAGVGTFALRLAETARVTAADGDGAALAALAKAARGTCGLKPVATEQRDLFRRPLLAADLKGHDAVVFDPPRQGADAQARQLAASRVPTIVAVSCNPATFARDAALLVAGGYRIDRVVPVDQFLYSAHVELVARFTR